MARAWNKLSANFVRSVSKRGRHADGGNLQLQIAKGGTKAWVFAYQRNGIVARWAWARRAPCRGAGALACGTIREHLARGIDPIDARRAAALAQQAARAKQSDLEVCAEEYHAANVTRWTNASIAPNGFRRVQRSAFPVIGHLSVDMIGSAHVQKVLAPLVTVSRSRLRACADGSKRCSTMPRRRDGAPARTRPRRPSSPTCCRCARKSRR